MEEPARSLRCSFTKGRAHSLIHGASAKSLLAFLPQPLRKRLIEEQLGEGTPACMTLQAQINDIRACGYAVSEGEVDEGVWGVSVPLVSHQGRLEGTITLMAPTLRAAPRKEELISLTKKAANRICNHF
jgi:DNA-binding IclR family transcriptional regulator